MAKIIMKDNAKAWDLIMKRQTKAVYDGRPCVWVGFDKSRAEGRISRRTTALLAKIRGYALEKGIFAERQIKKAVDADWDRGRIWQRKDNIITQLFALPRATAETIQERAQEIHDKDWSLCDRHVNALFPSTVLKTFLQEENEANQDEN